MFHHIALDSDRRLLRTLNLAALWVSQTTFMSQNLSLKWEDPIGDPDGSRISTRDGQRRKLLRSADGKLIASEPGASSF